MALAIPFTSATEKRDLLAVYIATILEAHPSPQDSSGLRVETRLRDAAVPLATPDLRKAVMGDPMWYLEVFDVGQDQRTIPDAELRWLGGVHLMRVNLFLEYVDADRFEDSSQATWDELVRDVRGDPCGLLPALKTLGVTNTSLRSTSDPANQMSLRQPEGIELDITPFDLEGISRAHTLTFLIGVEDVL